MFKVEKFHLDDVVPLLNEPMNKHLGHWSASEYKYAKHIEKNSIAMTVKIDGEPMLCVFLVEMWTGRGYAVVILSEKIKSRSVAVYRGMRKYLPSLPFNRIEFDLPCDFELGHRRAKFLGFDVMCERAKRYLPNGGDASVYQWVRP